ncbi:sporulation protein [Kroppenstedtia pulmonis]|uniref:Sporulation protein n=1 Tax=Kroppenstedtia pulmonis TaxID=1380685 RepID=A0A7D3XQH9_9BACL|nr:sporulation protein [Kroppenstedtia pulmonis]QKG83448.1 sporulation protein [Kroppenstedtia pulmonis]
MSLFNKALASLGVGNAKVDTRLNQTQYRQGGLIEGEVFIQGGQVEQEVDEIYLYLVIVYHQDGSQHEYIMEEFRLCEVFTIGPRETKVIPFELRLPFDTPLTTGGCPVYLKTGLDIKMSIDPDDTDGIEVLPHPMVEKVLKVMEYVGFQLIDIEFDFENYYSSHPFIQKFIFQPTGELEDKLQQVDVMFYVGESEMEVILQLDRKATDLMGTLEEALDLDYRTIRLTVTERDVENMEDLIERFSEKINEHAQ